MTGDESTRAPAAKVHKGWPVCGSRAWYEFVPAADDDCLVGDGWRRVKREFPHRVGVAPADFSYVPKSTLSTSLPKVPRYARFRVDGGARSYVPA